jgi:hypothetical protein
VSEWVLALVLVQPWVLALVLVQPSVSESQLAWAWVKEQLLEIWQQLLVSEYRSALEQEYLSELVLA